jgi:hypothetical protein
MFASLTQTTIAVPWDPPHTVTVRKLTGHEIEHAQKAHGDSLAAGESRFWAARFRRMLEGSVSDKQAVEQAIRDPLTGYNRFAIVRAGLLAWSYPQSLKPLTPSQIVDGQATDAIDDLDDEGVDFIATEILRLTKPGLFHATVEDAETAKKND